MAWGGVAARWCADGGWRDAQAAASQWPSRQTAGWTVHKHSSSCCVVIQTGRALLRFLYTPLHPHPSLSPSQPPPPSTISREVGDGNINFVYIVTGPAGALCLKQSLPYVRMVGAGWPLTQARLAVEVEALRTQARLCPRHVPAVYTFDRALAVVGMQCVPPPHTILRGALVRGEVFPRLSEHVAHFLAATLFNTSFLALSPQAFQ